MSSASRRQPLRKRGPFDSLEQTSPGTHLQEDLDNPIQSLLDHVSIPDLQAFYKSSKPLARELGGAFFLAA